MPSNWRFNQTLTMTPDVRREWHRAINRIPDGAYAEMDLAPRRELSRSTDANRWYFRNVVTPLARFLMDQEEELSTLERAKDYAHYEIIVKTILGVIERQLPGGIIIEIPHPTHTLSKEEFHDFSSRAEVFVMKFLNNVDAEDDAAPAAGPTAAAARGGAR